MSKVHSIPDTWDDNSPNVVSPNECFLNCLELPLDESLLVDLRQAAVVVMAHLDRLATPYLPQTSPAKVCSSVINKYIICFIVILKNNLLIVEQQGSGRQQEVNCWGSMPSPSVLEALAEVGVIQIVCTETGMLVLGHAGKVYSLPHVPESEVSLCLLRF